MAKDPLDFVQRGKVLIVRRQYLEAARVCRLGLLGQPQLLEGRLVLGMALMSLGRFEEVLGEMRVALDIDDRSPLAWLLKGEALSLKGDYAQAERVLLRARELDPSNDKADKLLADVRTALAAGLSGAPAASFEEPPETKEYPARLRDLAASTDGNGSGETTRPTARVPQVDLDPAAATKSSKVEIASDFLPDATFVDDGAAEEPTVPDTAPVPLPPSRAESSYEEPALDDYADAPRRLRPTPRNGAASSTSPSQLVPRAGRPSQPQPYQESVVAARPPLLDDEDDGIESGVEVVSSADLEIIEEGTVRARPSPSGVRAAASRPPEAKRRSDRPPARRSEPRPPRVSSPPTPRRDDPPAGRAGEIAVAAPVSRPSSPPPPSVPVRAPPRSSNDAETVITGSRPVAAAGGQAGFDPVSAPTIRRPRAPAVTTAVGRSRVPFTSRRALFLVAGAAATVVIVATGSGIAVREYRVRARVERHREVARQKLASGTWAGYSAAAEEYRRILLDRSGDDGARASRARILSAMAFEFSEPVDAASRAVSALGDDESEDAQLARIYLALARGDLARARRLAAQAQASFAGATPRYLSGRVELLLERPDDAARSISSAVERDPRDPLLLHGLGLAEAARRRDGAAMEAFGRALELSPNHVASIIDRAGLQIARRRDVQQARSYLESVVAKLSAEASPAELGRAYLALGEMLLASGDLEGGRSMLIRASAKRPDGDAALSEGLAAAYLNAFELDTAEREARKAIESSRGRSSAYLTLAQVALLRGRAQEALHDVGEAGLAKPEALVVRGRAYLALSRFAEARADLDEAIRLAPDMPEARVARCRVDVADGRAAQAHRELDRLERARLAPSQVAEGIGFALLAQGQPDRARYWFAAAVERNPLALEARLELARLYVDDGRLEEARAELKRAVDANPEFAPAWRELAALSLDESDLLAAREEYDALARHAPSDASALLGAARARLLLGDVAGGEARISRAERLGASAEEVADLRALMLLRSGRPTDAVKLLEPLLPAGARPETAALFISANNLARHPLSARAVQDLVPARLRSASEVLIAQARGDAEAGRSARAEAIADQVLRRGERGHLAPSLRAEALAVRGRALYDQGSAAAAARELEAALKLDPHSARAAYQLALVRDDQHQTATAQKLMELAAQSDPSFPDAQFELGRLRALTSDPTAKDAFAAYLRLEPDGPYADDARLGVAPQRTRPRPKHAKQSESVARPTRSVYRPVPAPRRR